MFADTPHLYKLLRNHLLDNGLPLPNGGVIDKQLFTDVLAIDSGNEFRILPKLGVDTHIMVSMCDLAKNAYEGRFPILRLKTGKFAKQKLEPVSAPLPSCMVRR